MRHVLPPLPYAHDALAPHISERTMRLHHGKHHAGYVDRLNGLLPGTRYAEMSLDRIVAAAADDPEAVTLFENAAQCANHALFWTSMAPDAGPAHGDIGQRIENRFGSFAGFADSFVACAATRFASGWTWLVVNGGQLDIETTGNAARPAGDGRSILLVCDLWEHAYYLDHENARHVFVRAFIEKLADWRFANLRLALL